jgi:16S rRNA U516 pseudouridylate synthase RsuA-like enzyme
MAEAEQALAPDNSGERLAKVMARAGLCSRREAERWVAAGRVSVNGKTVTSPALNVSEADKVVVDGRPLPQAAETRLWRYHKPAGLVVSHSDPQGRPTVFEKLPAELPRVVSIGRLDINTEGLLLLTNDGGLARTLELPATGWTRRYRVRVYGRLAPSITRASASIRRAALASLAATAARRKSSAECCLRVIATAISLSPPCESPAQGNHIAAPRGIPRESESKAVGIKWGALRVRHNFVPRVARRL